MVEVLLFQKSFGILLKVINEVSYCGIVIGQAVIKLSVNVMLVKLWAVVVWVKFFQDSVKFQNLGAVRKIR
jgi:hypothetical protein